MHDNLQFSQVCNQLRQHAVTVKPSIFDSHSYFSSIQRKRKLGQVNPTIDLNVIFSLALGTPGKYPFSFSLPTEIQQQPNFHRVCIPNPFSLSPPIQNILEIKNSMRSVQRQLFLSKKHVRGKKGSWLKMSLKGIIISRPRIRL